MLLTRIVLAGLMLAGTIAIHRAQLQSVQGGPTHTLQSNITTGQLDAQTASEVRAAFDSAGLAVNSLNKSKPKVDDEFVGSVNQAIEVFNDVAMRLNAGGRLREQDTATLRLAALDLELKAEWFKSVSAKEPAVRVSVNTKDKEGAAKPGCEVWYVTAFYQDVPSRAGKFDQLSTPTTQSLRVGAYVMWTLRDGKKGERKPVRVGARGATEMSVDLPVPQ